MALEDDIRLRLSMQGALLGNVTPSIREVSGDIDTDRREVRLRFVFDGEPSESVRSAASDAAALVIAQYDAGWSLDEEYVSRPAPSVLEALRLRAYLRCEDEWVTPRA